MSRVFPRQEFSGPTPHPFLARVPAIFAHTRFFFGIGLLLAASCLYVCAQVNVTTYHNDNSRTGLNASETMLTPANVNPEQFGKLFSQKVDGQIYGQPLYVSHLNIPSKGTHNVVFVATEADSVYAFDADSSAGPFWRASLLDPAHGAAPGATAVNASDLVRCTAIVPKIGITSTPVIDLNPGDSISTDAKTGTIYVEAMSKEGTQYVHRIHALDITTGAERPGSPVMVKAAVPGEGDGKPDGKITFDGLHHLNRPGLLLVNGVIYVAYGTQCDRGPAHGWLFAYRASNLSMLDVFLTTPNGSWGGIWMSGAGLAADKEGNLFIATGNGTFDDSTPAKAKELSQAILKFSLRKDRVKDQEKEHFALLDYFAPFNHDRLNRHDRDLGSGGVLLLPDQPGEHPHLLIQSGKEGKVYLVDRDQMTKDNLHVCAENCTSDPQIVQEIPDAEAGMWSMPAYWNNTVYFWASMDTLRAFRLQEGKLGSTPVGVSKEKYEHPGANVSVSSDGNKNAILWAIRTEAFETEGPAVLAAYDAADVGHLLYTSDMKKERDGAGGAVKFTVPTVVNGKVYLGAAGELDVYGLLRVNDTKLAIDNTAAKPK